MRTTILILAATLTCGLVACGDDSSASSGTGGASGSGGSASQGTDVTSTSSGEGGGDGSITRAFLIGTWETSCYVETGIYYGKSVTTFTETGLSSVYKQFENDPTCSDDTKLFVIGASTASAWSLGAVLDSGATAYDAVNAGATFTTVTDLATANWNAGSGCGPFTAGASVHVDGQVCFGFPTADIGGTEYDAIFPDPQGIRFGSPTSGNGSSPDTRPTTPEPGEKGIFRKR